MLTALWYREGGLVPVSREELAQRPVDAAGLLWVDVQDPEPADLALLRRAFGFHPLALEDVVKRSQRPKIDRYDSYEFIVLYDVQLVTDGSGLELSQVGIFMAPRYVVTTHHGTVQPIVDLYRRWQEYPGLVEPHPLGFLLYNLADGLVDGYFPVADRLEARIDDLEAELFGQVTTETLRKLLRLREELIVLRRIVGPERDIFNILTRRDHPVIDESTAAFFNDIYDHLLRIAETLDTYRELLSGALDVYVSQQSNKLNVVVKRLTAITLVLMVVTAVTGFFGMNVGFPGRDEPLGLQEAVAAMVVLGLGAWGLARRQEWL